MQFPKRPKSFEATASEDKEEGLSVPHLTTVHSREVVP